MKTLLACLLALYAFAVRADVVTDWNTATYQVLRAVQVDGAPGARALAIVHVSAQYARDYHETKTFGGARSTARTNEQSGAVKFWSQPNIMEAWHQVTRQVATNQKLGLAESARVFAIMTMANANSFIVDWDAKFHYNLWRPVTAIRNGDNDGNDATERDAGWTPLNDTPMHPEYPSQAAILAGAGSAALALVSATPDAPVTITDSRDLKVTRPFTSVAKLAEEQRLVRIWGGIHFRTSLEVSDGLGKALVKHLADTTYRPVR